MVSTFDRYVMAPLLVAIALDLGASLDDVVRAAGAYFLAYGLSQPLWGLASERFGRVPTMRVTLLLAGLCSLGSAFVAGPAALVVARVLAGGFFGAAYPSSLIYLGDTVPHVRRQRDITGLMVGVAVGTSLASVAGGIIADVATWRIAFVLTGSAAVGLAWLLRWLPEPETGRATRSVRATVARALSSRWARLVLVLAFAEGGVIVGALTLLPAAVEATGTSFTTAGLTTAVYGVSVYLCARTVGALSRRWRPASLLALGGTAAVAACLVLTASRSPAAAVVGAALLGLAWAAMHSTLQTWSTEVVPEARAMVVSLFAASLFAGSSASALLTAGLAESGRYDAAYLAFSAVAVPLAVVGTVGRARWHPSGA